MVNLPETTSPTNRGTMRVNTTVTNVSPLLLYTPQILWREAPINESVLSSPTQSYHATNGSAGKASVSFSWTGTGIWIYGGHRNASGPYKVNLNGETMFYNPGFQSGDAQQADALLYGIGNLTSNQYTMELISVSDDAQQDLLEFDYLVFESQWNDEVESYTMNESSTGWTYAADGSLWQNTTTNSPFGTVSLNFKGEAIAVYGSVSSTQAPYTVAVDSGPPQQFFPNTQLNKTNQLLFFTSGLEQRSHSLVIRNNPNALIGNDSTTLSVDYAVVNSTRSDVSASTGSNKHVNIVVGSTVAAAAVLLALLYFCVRWYGKKQSQYRQKQILRSPRPFVGAIPVPQPMSQRSSRPHMVSFLSGTVDIVARYSEEAADGSRRSSLRGRTPATSTQLPANSSRRVARLKRLPSEPALIHRATTQPPANSGRVATQTIQLQASLPPPYHMVRHRL